MRLATEAHQLMHRHAFRRVRLLGQQRDALRDITAPETSYVLTLQQYRTSMRCLQAGQTGQQRGLATAVGPDDGRHLAIRQRQRQRIDHGHMPLSAAIPQRQLTGLESGGHGVPAAWMMFSAHGAFS